MQGWMRFYAPKGVGRFIFRIYDETDIVPTLATSNALAVSLSHSLSLSLSLSLCVCVCVGARVRALV